MPVRATVICTHVVVVSHVRLYAASETSVAVYVVRFKIWYYLAGL